MLYEVITTRIDITDDDAQPVDVGDFRQWNFFAAHLRVNAVEMFFPRDYARVDFVRLEIARDVCLELREVLLLAAASFAYGTLEHTVAKWRVAFEAEVLELDLEAVDS